MVSVIITTYKRKTDILKRAIDTVYSQTYKNIEIIVVNDYPPYGDMIAKFLENYPQIKYLGHTENKGACKSRNDGISIAKGDYIAFLDDDDEWQTSKIEHQVEAIIRENVDLVYCSGVYNMPDGTTKRMDFIKATGKNPIEDLLLNNCVGGCSFPLITKSILTQVGGFNEKMPSSQDYDLWVRICQRGKLFYLDEKLVRYNLQEDSITANYLKRKDGYYLMLYNHNDLYKKYPTAATGMYKRIARMAYINKDYDGIIEALMKSFSYFPHNFAVCAVCFKLYILLLKESRKSRRDYIK